MIVIPLVGFRLALRQDEVRWVREKRAELYVDVLAEAYAEKQWMLQELSRREAAEISAEFYEADRDQDDDRWPNLPDTRLDPAARAHLGARMAAFSTDAVVQQLNQLSVAFPFLPKAGEATAAKWRVEAAFDDLEKLIRDELGSSK